MVVLVKGQKEELDNILVGAVFHGDDSEKVLGVWNERKRKRSSMNPPLVSLSGLIRPLSLRDTAPGSR